MNKNHQPKVLTQSYVNEYLYGDKLKAIKNIDKDMLIVKERIIKNKNEGQI